MCSKGANLSQTRRSSAGPSPSEEGALCRVNGKFQVQSHQDSNCGGAADLYFDLPPSMGEKQANGVRREPKATENTVRRFPSEVGGGRAQRDGGGSR